TDYANNVDNINSYADERVVRGGSWRIKHNPYNFRCDFRGKHNPLTRHYNFFGFRIARLK
ncbi:MAG: SUMF1/EgtB/PvdO family nonheme iron enzyme, partial [Chloroflexota bacterium]